jgi:hypothetical protein
MNQVILASIISAASALIGVWITQYYNAKKNQSEEKRWYSDYFLKAKIEALQNVYSTLNDCFSTLRQYLDYPQIKYDERGDGVFRFWRCIDRDRKATGLWVYVFYDGLCFQVTHTTNPSA